MKSCASFIRNYLGAFAFAFAIANNAVAVDINVGNLAGTSFAQVYSFSPGAIVNDVYHFDLDSPVSFSAIASQLALLSYFNVGDFSVSLAMPTGPVLNFTPDLTGSVISTGILPLAQGNDFKLTVNGLVNGTLGGGYSVMMGAAVSHAAPVPEPAHIWLLLAGIALLLVMVRSRRLSGTTAAQSN
jgi:hypothetical protein